MTPVALFLGLFAALQPLAALDLVHSTFENGTPTYNPWPGATAAGTMAGIPGKQPSTDSTGKVGYMPFGPSVAVGDLNGDGLPDLVVGDAYGYIWFFPNSGTATAPKFTQGEIMPVWLGATMGDPDYDGLEGWNEMKGGSANLVSRVQLVSLQGTKLLDLVVGTFTGRLYYLHNTGSTSQPVFKTTPSRLKEFIVKTRRDGLLWCNFLCPMLYDWWGTGNLDLLIGDGSYSANSIFLFKNTGSRDNPTFDVSNMTKIIPGMGREHLNPQVVDWNNDGKPDIISGDRLGHINLFLNTSADAKQAVPTFDDGQLVKLGGRDTFGPMTTVAVGDLTGNKLPNLIITDNTGTISYATNTGKLGAPQFGAPVPIPAVNPLPKILLPIGWNLHSPYGVPNELLVCTNATIEPDFTPPPNTTFKNALRYYVVPITNKYFPDSYYPLSDQDFDDTHTIRCETKFMTKDDTSYHVSFWVRSSGNITNLKYYLTGWRTEPGEDPERVTEGKTINSSNTWTLFQDTISFEFKKKKKTDASSRHESAETIFEIRFNGQGEIYLDDVKISADQS